MPVSESADTGNQAQVGDADLQGEFRVDCYVRSAMPAPLVGTVSSITERLQQLHDQGAIAECQITHWPPEYATVATVDDTDGPTRDELVTGFEQWAEQHGCTLEPAFRREKTLSSALGLETNETREQVRVPFVALALYEANTERDSETETLQGVVPCTESSNTAEGRTYTVHEWLSALDIKEYDDSTYQPDQATVLEGQL